MISKWIPLIAAIGIACLGLGFCSILRQNGPTSNLKIVLGRPVTIFPDGKIALVVVPAPASQGIKAVDATDKRQFVINAGDDIEITTTGTVQVGPGRPVVGPDGETTGYVDAGVDSPFKKNVGGLEMWFDPDKTSGQRYLIGPHFHQRIMEPGVPTFRVIDALPNSKGGYKGTGTFIVTIIKR